jgi:hypothetical protein
VTAKYANHAKRRDGLEIPFAYLAYFAVESLWFRPEAALRSLRLGGEDSCQTKPIWDSPAGIRGRFCKTNPISDRWPAGPWGQWHKQSQLAAGRPGRRYKQSQFPPGQLSAQAQQGSQTRKNALGNPDTPGGVTTSAGPRQVVLGRSFGGQYTLSGCNKYG